jgi:drug/metabolite transporter (DMT)-like permease
MMPSEAQQKVAFMALSVFLTALAFVIYFRLVQTLRSVGTTAPAYLGVAIGVMFLRESLSSTGLIGLASVIAGAAIPSRPAKAIPAS